MKTKTYYILGKWVFNRFVLRRPVPILGDIKITYRCNSRCRFCNLWKDKGTSELDTEGMKGVIDNLSLLGVPLISFEGGEPLVRQDLKEILNYTRGKNFLIILVTNGILLEQKLPEISDYIDELCISCDGIGETHDRIRGVPGMFEKVKLGMQACRKYKIPFHLNCVITKDNIGQLSQLVRFAEENGAVGIGFQTMYDFDDTDQKLNDVNKEEMESTIRMLINMKREGRRILNTIGYLKLLIGETDARCIADFVINVSPDGMIAIPCPLKDEHWKCDFKLDNNLKTLWFSEEAKSERKKAEGCRKCHFPCYWEPSIICQDKRALLHYRNFLRVKA